VKLNAESGGDTATAGAAKPAAEESGWTRKNPFSASLISNEKLTGEGSANIASAIRWESSQVTVLT